MPQVFPWHRLVFEPNPCPSSFLHLKAIIPVSHFEFIGKALLWKLQTFTHKLSQAKLPHLAHPSLAEPAACKAPTITQERGPVP